MKELEKRINKSQEALKDFPYYLYNAGPTKDSCLSCHGSGQQYGRSWEGEFVDCAICKGSGKINFNA